MHDIGNERTADGSGVVRPDPDGAYRLYYTRNDNH